MNAKHNPDWSPEFWRIVECASDEPIAPADAEAFAEILAESPEAQRDYLAHIQLQADLHLLSASQQSLDKALARLETIVHPAEEPVLTKSSARFWIYGSLLGTAATVLLSLWLTRPVTNTSTGITRISGPQTVIPHTNVRKIKLDSGSVQMELDNVGTVVVAGPADFELLGNQRARLNSGRINLKVTESTGYGFVVETPDGEITDLGTEFALNVDKGRESSLIVRDGAVDLKISDAADSEFPQRLRVGEGVTFQRGGKMDRIMSVVSLCSAESDIEFISTTASATSLIQSVKDNLRSTDTRQYYEIVPGGLKEDAPAYVDRRHEWNGTSKENPIPSYLLNADYVRTFNNDKRKPETEITVELAAPARLYVLYDNRLEVPEWLQRDFVNTNDQIGQETAKRYVDGTKRSLEEGPGVRVTETFSIWVREVREPGIVVLGGNRGRLPHPSAMYGIAATPLDLASDAPLDQPAAGTANPAAMFFNAQYRSPSRATSLNQSFLASLTGFLSLAE